MAKTNRRHRAANTILNIIKQWTGNTKIANSLNWYKVASK